MLSGSSPNEETRSERHAAVDHLHGAGYVLHLVRSQVYGQCRNLFGITQSAHRLACDEVFSGLNRSWRGIDAVI
jgi:hypothetical protein